MDGPVDGQDGAATGIGAVRGWWQAHARANPLIMLRIAPKMTLMFCPALLYLGAGHVQSRSGPHPSPKRLMA